MNKICFYLSGNQRNFGKMSEIEQKCTVLLSILIFQFCFFSIFFGIPITFRNFLVTLSSQFFDFLYYITVKRIFVSQMPTDFEKIQKIYTFIVDTYFSIFFCIPITFTNFFGPLSSHFCVKYSPFFLKLRKSLPKVCFVGENPGHFTKHSSISWRVGTHFEHNVQN